MLTQRLANNQRLPVRAFDGSGVAMSDPGFTPVAALADIPPGTTMLVNAGAVPVLLCNSLDRIFAISNSCSHADEKLECGRIRNGWISCPAHGARFDLETGEPMNPPANRPIQTWPVRIVDGMIEVAV